jgi:hypothetical protein
MTRSHSSKPAYLIPYFAYKVKLSCDRSVAMALKIDSKSDQLCHLSLVKTSDGLGRAAGGDELRLLIEIALQGQPACGERHA